MPNAPDKIIINSNGTRGMQQAINAEYDTLLKLGKEIVDGGWAAETNDFRDEMKVACDAHHKADVKYYNFLRSFRDKLAAFIDSKS